MGFQKFVIVVLHGWGTFRQGLGLEGGIRIYGSGIFGEGLKLGFVYVVLAFLAWKPGDFKRPQLIATLDESRLTARTNGSQYMHTTYVGCTVLQDACFGLPAEG